MTTKSRKSTINQVANGGKTSYESSVVGRAVARAGKNPQLKGHIHEVMHADACNVKNLAKLKGYTKLTANPNAKCVDLVTTKAGKVVERMQLKDTLSDSQVNALVKRVKSGGYRGVKLIGTEETTAKVNAKFASEGLKRRMHSSGISSQKTTSLAQQAGATGSGTLRSAIATSARSGGAVGAVVGSSIEAISAISDYSDGYIDGTEVVVRVGKAGVKGGATGAASAAAATAVGAGTASLLATVGAGAAATAVGTFAAPVVAAVGVGYAVSKAMDWLFD